MERWNRVKDYYGLERMEVYKRQGIDVRAWNKLFNEHMRLYLWENDPDIYHFSKCIQKLIKEAVGIDQEDVVYAALAGTYQPRKRAAAEEGEQQ